MLDPCEGMSDLLDRVAGKRTTSEDGWTIIPGATVTQRELLTLVVETQLLIRDVVKLVPQLKESSEALLPQKGPTNPPSAGLATIDTVRLIGWLNTSATQIRQIDAILNVAPRQVSTCAPSLEEIARRWDAFRAQDFASEEISFVSPIKIRGPRPKVEAAVRMIGTVLICVVNDKRLGVHPQDGSLVVLDKAAKVPEVGWRGEELKSHIVELGFEVASAEETAAFLAERDKD